MPVTGDGAVGPVDSVAAPPTSTDTSASAGSAPPSGEPPIEIKALPPRPAFARTARRAAAEKSSPPETRRSRATGSAAAAGQSRAGEHVGARNGGVDRRRPLATDGRRIVAMHARGLHHARDLRSARALSLLRRLLGQGRPVSGESRARARAVITPRRLRAPGPCARPRNGRRCIPTGDSAASRCCRLRVSRLP